jgi:hypothetical protein
MSEGAIFLRGDLVFAANLAADYGLHPSGDSEGHVFVEADFLRSTSAAANIALGYIRDEDGFTTNYDSVTRRAANSVDLSEFDVVLSGALHREIRRNAASILRNEPIAELRHLRRNGLQDWLKRRDLKRQLTEIAFSHTKPIFVEPIPD